MPGAVQVCTAKSLPHTACGIKKHDSNKRGYEKSQGEGQEELSNRGSTRAEPFLTFL